MSKIKGDACNGCGVIFKKKSLSDYCAKCFHSNVDDVRAEYGKSRWKSGVSKRIHWEVRGVKLSEQDIEDFNGQGYCGICGSTFDNVKKCLDHCHKTGSYRGALCFQCNTSLGKLGDDLPTVIERLINYSNKNGSSL